MSKGNFIKKGAEKISGNISSGIIVDQFDIKNANLLTTIRNHIKNRVVLNQTEAAFLDYKRKQFPEQARFVYEGLYQAHKRKDKVELMRLLSTPLYDIFKFALKNDSPLPFQLYKEVLDVQFVQARVYSLHKHALNPSQTWHQLTMKFVCQDQELNKEVTKYNVFERREVDSSINDWRICHLE